MDLPELDITDETAFAKVLGDFKPDTVVNCAAYTNVDGCETYEAGALRVNGDAPGRMAAVCRERSIRFVHIGTDYVFDGTSTRPYREDDPPAPASAYGRTKLAGEGAVLIAEPAALVVRTAWLYGAKKSFVRAVVEKARKGEALSVVNDQHGAPTSAADLSEAILALVARGASGLVHFTNAGATTWHAVARFVLVVLSSAMPDGRGGATGVTTSEAGDEGGGAGDSLVHVEDFGAAKATRSRWQSASATWFVGRIRKM